MASLGVERVNYVGLPTVTAVGSFGGLIFGYNTGIISTALDLISGEFSITEDTIKGLITSSILVGALVGSLVAGVAADKFGRRVTTIIGSGICSFAALAQAFAPELITLLALRLVLGLGLGFVGVICPLYVSETAPAARRGFFGVIFQLSITFGILLSYFVGYLINTAPWSESYKWRVMVGLGEAFTAALFLTAVFAMTETYTWLASKGLGEAKRLNAALDDTVLEVATEQERGRSGLAMLFSAAGFKYLAMAVVLAFTLQMTGINAVMYFGPKILKAAHVGNEFLLNIGIGGWNFVTTFAAVFLVDRLGRRVLLLVGVGIMSLALALIAISFQYLSDTGLAIGVGAGLLAFIAGFEVGPGCIFWVIVNEYFPPPMKETGAALTNILQWGFNLVIAYCFLIATNALGSAVTFGIFAGIGAFCFIYLAIFLPETRAD